MTNTRIINVSERTFDLADRLSLFICEPKSVTIRRAIISYVYYEILPNADSVDARDSAIKKLGIREYELNKNELKEINNDKHENRINLLA